MATNLHVQMLFERYYAGRPGSLPHLGHDGQPRGRCARDMPADVEDVLLIPEEERTPEQERASAASNSC